MKIARTDPVRGKYPGADCQEEKNDRYVQQEKSSDACLSDALSFIKRFF
jgi:hypothetical protein